MNEATSRLQRAGLERPELAAEMLVASTLNCPRLELYLRLSEKLTSAHVAAIEKSTRRLGKHEPIQYVLGWTDFMGHILKCDSRALIPRPETEELADWIIKYEPLWKIECPAIIDIGTGNGCIIVSLALHNKKGKYWAVDISADAIALAEKNARSHGVLRSIKFITTDFAGKAMPPGLDAVVANPPYVRTADCRKLADNVRLWEPRAALDGGEDGLQVIRPLIKKAYEILKPNRFLFLEIGFDQWIKIQQLLAKTGFRQSFLRRDRAGQDRLVMAIK
ncbi:MAG: peptide chain release factor N(5)-glutamine methyltransferase [Kiritimatiellia bacterium]|nr:peptide chain release factor N(5)-glutamine methyltransferase [Kiritimatiellia bacterium]